LPRVSLIDTDAFCTFSAAPKARPARLTVWVFAPVLVTFTSKPTFWPAPAVALSWLWSTSSVEPAAWPPLTDSAASTAL
jgi:hypothetical protein